MKKSLLFFFLLPLLAGPSFAEEEGVGRKIVRGIEKGGKAAADGIEKGAQATGRGVNKAVDATGRVFKKAGDWADSKVPKKGSAGGDSK